MVIIITMLALAIPVAGVLYWVNGIAAGRRSEANAEEIAAGLQDKLVEISQEKLPGTTIEGGKKVIELTVNDTDAMKTKIENTARDLGGVAISSDPTRILVQLPETEVAAFLGQIEPTVRPSEVSDGLIEILLTKKP